MYSLSYLWSWYMVSSLWFLVILSPKYLEFKKNGFVYIMWMCLCFDGWFCWLVFLCLPAEHWESSAGYLRSSVTALGCRIVVSALSGKSSTGFYVLLWFARHSRIVVSSASCRFATLTAQPFSVWSYPV